MITLPDGWHIPGGWPRTPVGTAANVAASPDVLVLTLDARAQRQAVRAMLARAKLSPAAAAEQLGISRQSLDQYLTPNGRRKIVRLDWLLRLASLCRSAVVIQLPPP